MAILVQYHNFDVEGPLPLNLGFQGNLGIFTRKSMVQNFKRARVYLIAGLGKRRRYFLWETFEIEKVRRNGEEYEAEGPGRVLDPPRELGIDDQGQFLSFLKFMGHFGRGLTNIEGHSYAKILEGMSVPGDLQGNSLDDERAYFAKALIEIRERSVVKYYGSADLHKLRDRVDASIDAEPVGATNASTSAGYGSPETNRETEMAAIRLAEQYHLRRGWQVCDVSKANRGYDLECKKGNRTRNVEVKGVRGTECSFNITANEYRQAREDADFCLFVVTSALASPVLHIYMQKDIQKAFEFSPMQYRATLRKPQRKP